MCFLTMVLLSLILSTRSVDGIYDVWTTTTIVMVAVEIMRHNVCRRSNHRCAQLTDCAQSASNWQCSLDVAIVKWPAATLFLALKL